MARVRKPKNQVVIQITVDQITTIYPLQSEAAAMSQVPRQERLTLLEQSLPESKLDLAKVIKAINSL